jgi:hypothetical protein
MALDVPPSTHTSEITSDSSTRTAEEWSMAVMIEKHKAKHILKKAGTMFTDAERAQ